MGAQARAPCRGTPSLARRAALGRGRRARLRSGSAPSTSSSTPASGSPSTGRNGSGKTTLVRALLGEVELDAGTRVIGRGVVVGVIGQERVGYTAPQPLLEAFSERTGLDAVDARTLLAKFGLGASHVLRACATLSPGERTRAHLADLQAAGVNLLVLDEPTNHLDLEAVEQLEQALATWDGALVVVSARPALPRDRRTHADDVAPVAARRRAVCDAVATR